MPRGAKGAKPAKAKVEAKLPVAPKSPKNEGSRVGDLEKRLAEAERETEALERGRPPPRKFCRRATASLRKHRSSRPRPAKSCG